MKHITCYLIFLFHTFFIVHAQVKTIDNIQTAEHIEIPGTKYSIIKPDESFSVTTDFTGLMSKEFEAGINIAELPMAFNVVLPMFTKDLPPKNGKLVLEKDLVMNGYQAKLYKTDVIHKSAISQLTNPDEPGKAIISWLLIYGDENFCLTISATYPSSKDKKLSDKLERSLLSFLYSKDKKVDPLAGLVFDLDLGDTPLQFASTFMQTGAVFNIDGKFPSEAEDRTSYIIMVMPFEVEEEKQRAKAIRAVKKPLKEDTEIKEVNPIDLGELKGYEVVGYEKNKNDELNLMYSVTLFDENRHFIITGMSKIEMDDKLKMFRSLSQTFKLK